MKFVKLLFLFLICGFVCTSSKCRKNNCTDPKNDKPKVVLTPDEFKAYFNFKAGSYWVYQDSATGKLDSVVLDSTFTTWDEGKGLDDCENLHVFKRVENIISYYSAYDSAGNKTGYSRTKLNNNGKIYSNDNDNTFILEEDGNIKLVYPFSGSFSDFGYMRTINFYPDILINNGNYKNIVRVFSNDTNSPKNWPYYYIYYHEKNIGVIHISSVDAYNNNHTSAMHLIRYMVK